MKTTKEEERQPLETLFQIQVTNKTTNNELIKINKQLVSYHTEVKDEIIKLLDEHDEYFLPENIVKRNEFEKDMYIQHYDLKMDKLYSLMQRIESKHRDILIIFDSRTS